MINDISSTLLDWSPSHKIENMIDSPETTYAWKNTYMQASEKGYNMEMKYGFGSQQ